MDPAEEARILDRGLDDWEQCCFIPHLSGSGLIEEPAKAVRMWRAEFEALRADGGCFVLTAHPFPSGRPGRTRALEELVADVAADSGVWLASLGEIAGHVRGLALAPRGITPPTGECRGSLERLSLALASATSANPGPGMRQLSRPPR